MMERDRTTEEELRKSKRRFEALVQASAQVVFTTNGGGEVEEDSPTWREYTGQTFAQLKGLGWLDALHPDDRIRVARTWQKHANAPKPISVVYRLRHHSGAWHWMAVRATPLVAEDGSIAEWIGLNTDITERQDAEEMLHRQAAFFEAVNNNSTELIYKKDLAGRITDANAATLRAVGRTHEEVIGMLDTELFHRPAERVAIAENDRRIIMNGETLTVEQAFTCADGQHRVFLVTKSPSRDENGDVIGIIGVGCDVTERQRSEMMLSEQKRVLELIASGQPLEQCLAALTNAVSRLHYDARAAVLLADASRAKMERVLSSTIPQTFGACIVGLPINDEFIGTCGRAIYKAETITCADIRQSEVWSEPWKDLCGAHGVAACHSTPIVDMDGKGLASFLLCFGTAREPNQWERRLGEFGAHIASIVIERDRARKQLDAELVDAKLLRRAATALVDEDSVEGVAEAILDAAVSIMRSDLASMQMFYPERGSGGELRVLALRGFSAEAAKLWEWVRTDSHSICGEALRTRRRTIVHDLHECDFMAGTEGLAMYLQNGIRAVQTTPLISRRGKLVGMLSTHWRQPHTPNERDWRLLDILARQAADLLERKEVEQSLRESEHRFRQMANNIASLAWMANPDGGMFWYNERWYEYTGTTLEEMQGWGWDKVHEPTELQRMLPGWRRSLETGEPWEDTFPLRGKTGQYRWFLARAFPIRNARGEIERWVGTNTDITDLHQAQDALKEADRRKDAFLAMLAHELRNPLAPVRNAALVLKKGARGRLAPSEERACDIIERQVSHMTRLIDDLLDVSRIARGKVDLQVERLEITSLIQSAVEDQRPFVEGQGLTLTMNAQRRLFVEGDRTRLAQVVSNLLHNAAKFTPQGGTIAVSIVQRDNSAQICVRDTGVGFSPRLAEHIFEPFVQADNSLHRSKGGLGLGLALVKGIVELHRGQVFARSSGDARGSEFEISLPLLPTPEPRTSAMWGGADSTICNKKVLIIEDNKDVAETLEMLLHLAGCGTQTAYDGVEGLRAIPLFGPDIVLCDIGLPLMDGYEIAEETRKRRELDGIRLIAMSGYGQKEDVEKALKAGFNAHLTKPVDPERLLRMLSEA